MGSPQHRRGERPDGRDGRGAAQGLESRDRVTVAQPHRLLLHARAGRDPAAAKPPLEEVDVRAGEAREGRSQVRVEVAPAALLPGEAEQCEQRLPERRLREPHAPLDREGDPERGERRVDRRPPALERGHDDRDLLQRGACVRQLADLLRDELERAPASRSLEEAQRALELGAGRRLVGEEVTLDVCERRVAVLGRPRRQLLDSAVGERAEVLDRPLQRREGRSPGLVGQRDGDLAPARQRLEEPPLRAGQVLEAVGEDRSSVPGRELRAHALDGPAAQQVTIPEPEAVELAAVGRVQPAEVAAEVIRVDEAGLELGECREQRVGEAAEARRAAEAVERGAAESAADDQHPLRVADDRSRAVTAEREVTEEIVERPDRAVQERAGPAEQVALDAVDVRRVRHDQNRIAFDLREIALEEAGDLAGLGRPDDECETHRPMVVRGPDGSRPRGGQEPERAENARGRGLGPPAGDVPASLGGRGLRPAAAAGDLPAAHLLGLCVRHVELPYTLAGVVKGDAHGRALSLRDFLPRDIGYQHCLASHKLLLEA